MKDLFIILPGPSLNNLSAKEKDYIKSRPTISSGHYLMYWETIGIVPDHYIWAGYAWDNPTSGIVPGGIFYGFSVICKHHNLKTDFFVSKENKLYLDGGPIPSSAKHPTLGKSLKPCVNNHKILSHSIDISESPSYQSEQVWAKNLKDKFWFNSGVGSAINLASVLYPNHNIKLIGNDGGPSNQYFYNQNKCNKDLITLFAKELKNRAKPPSGHSKINHYNMSFFNTQYAIKKVKESGCNLYNCNKKSFFTKGGEQYIDKTISYKNNKNLFQIPYSPILSN